MANTAFISHSERDEEAANKMVAELERAGINCWIAPRNIRPGQTYAAAIVEGIRSSDLFILIFTKASNNSDAVINEIESAQSMKKTIITIRFDNIPYSDSLDYYLKSKHHINQYDKSAENVARNLLVHLKLKPPDDNNGHNGHTPKPVLKRKWLITGSVIIATGLLALYFIVNNNRNHSNKPIQKTETIPASNTDQQIIVPENMEATITSSPYRVLAGSEAEIMVYVFSEKKVPVDNAAIKLSAGGGYFGNSMNRYEVGHTNEKGVYRTRWKAPNPAMENGSYQIDVTAEKKDFKTADSKLAITTYN